MVMLTRQNFSYFLIAIIAMANLHACGFQLRGAINLSSDMSPVYVEQNSAFDLAREIKSLLTSNKIAVVTSEKQSKTQLVLLNEGKNRRVLSVDGNGRAREYLLTYSVNFVIKTKQDVALETETTAMGQEEVVQEATQEATQKKTAPEKAVEKNQQDSISITRTWLFDPNAVLAVSNEAEILYKDMRRDAARLILLKLNARSMKSENK